MPRKRTQREFINQSNKYHNDVYGYQDVTYVDDNTKISVTCKHHGSFRVTPTNHIHRKSGCPNCAKIRAGLKLAMSVEQFIEKAKSIHGELYDYSQVVYKNNHTKIKILCSKHGIFEQQPNIHTDQRCGCPKCNISKGETRVRNWLLNNNVNFIEQYKFNDCIDKSQLIFDFYLPSEQVLIEFNGIQHYRFISSFHKTIEEFNNAQRRDNIKIAYAKDKGLQFLTIPYNKNTELMLNQFFHV